MREQYDFVEETATAGNSDDENHENGNRRAKRYTIPFYSGIAILISLGLLYISVFFIDNVLPMPLTVADEKLLPDSFIAERAISNLQSLTSIGQRVTGGYENEVLTVNFLKHEIDLIIRQAHPNQEIQLDIQVVTGAYTLDLINAYSNIQNVIVKLFGKNKTTNSILVNSHFDSVPTSPGGSDDGINVAVMLEVMRKLSKSPDRPLHNIIFLFNGAEETPLQASHGFITKHNWAKECKVVINLEACGAGGKIILFQSGPETPWLISYYSKVPHPYGQAAGEEIFQAGLIPSGTDFRIFRDFGGLVGLDMAFYKNGYRYHTKYDDFEHIPNGSYQHVGDNSLFLVKNLANAPEVTDPVPSPGKMIYFDVLGWFMVSYTTFTAAIFNSLVFLMSISVFIWTVIDFKLKSDKATFKYIGITFAAIFGGWILAGLSVCLIAYILDLIGRTMSWYANSWILIGLYVAPTIALSGCLLFLVNSKNLATNIRCFIQAHIVRLIWTIIFIVGTILNIRAMYALMVPILFNTIGFVMIHGLRWHYTVIRWQIIYLVSLIIPTVLIIYQMLLVMSLFIPLTGRMGSDKNPDIIIGVMTVFFTILITSPFVALITLMQNAKYFFATLGAVFLIFLIIIFTPLGFPYRGNPDNPTPQRQWLLHTERIFHNERGEVENSDAGIFWLNLDRNSPSILKDHVKNLSKARSLEEDCVKYPLCGVPLSHPKMTQIIQYSTWIPASPPEIPEPKVITLHSKEYINSTLVRYNVTITGPDRLAIYLVPKINMKVIDISLIEFLKPSKYMYNGRQVYFILHTYGKDPATLNFTFNVNVPVNYNGTTVDFAVSAWYVHDNKFVKTPYYSDMLKQFPDWVDVTPWVGSYSLFIL